VPKYEKCVIVIEDWQMQCCGTSFKLGDRVDWLVAKYGKRSEVTESDIDYYYEHHSSEWEKLFKAKGTVAKIQAMYCRLEARPNEFGNKQGMVNYRIYEKAVEVDTAYGCGDDEGWHDDIDGLEFGEYELTLHNCDIAPAKQSEVTFS